MIVPKPGTSDEDSGGFMGTALPEPNILQWIKAFVPLAPWVAPDGSRTFNKVISSIPQLAIRVQGVIYSLPSLGAGLRQSLPE